MPLAREQRKLAAILAADVVGYSRLMGRDESGTLSRLKAHRTERFEPALARNGGRLVKVTGDGALAEFGSAVDALSAAIEFQQAVADANRDQPEDTAIAFRMGLLLKIERTFCSTSSRAACDPKADVPEPGRIRIEASVEAVGGHRRLHFGPRHIRQGRPTSHFAGFSSLACCCRGWP
jgi:hypothetical protein